MGKHKIWIDDGIIRGKLFGIHDERDAKSVITAINGLVEKEESGRILIDMGGVEKATLEARKVHLDNFLSNPDAFEKLALFGANTTNRVMANFMIKAVKLEDKIKYFNSETDALNWLNEH